MKSTQQKTMKPVRFRTSNQTIDDLKNQYEVDYKNPLGSGQYGLVFKAKNQKDQTQKVAIKCITKKGMTIEELMDLKKEVQIMMALDHPNIVKYFETYEDWQNIFLVMELCEGGEILKSQENRTEAMWAKEVRKLLKALNHCHQQGIIHRDIKPTNIMHGEDHEIKLIDFGFAIKANNRRDENTIAGTPLYIAPEVLSLDYDQECDVWSLGVCIYQFLTGKIPFDGDSLEELFQRIKSGKFSVPKSVSPEAKDLLKQMIQADRSKRITAAKALEHPWITMHHSSPTSTAESLVEQKILEK